MVRKLKSVGWVVTMLVLLTTSSSSSRGWWWWGNGAMGDEQPQQEECAIVKALISACSSFVMYGAPDPIPGSPCCVAMLSLSNVADSTDNRQNVCRCMMDLITTYNPNATSIATLPGFCGVSLGFIIDPNTDCEYIG
ncbi:hypothetical protein DM860_016041 [Cuscuta australis]|uniref:Bifunctional inhibitor/plant lipid transfer protein/seed storage helical domain-containing protein n=2 Tax=Cuscuta sect. Cleistogrammica TaxID=1824901 RepID=A0A328E2F0_9ASTE|nr:hypothetical protein DM860_016041 [Cuscuta australis]